MKAYIKFFFEILPLAVFFTVNSVENIYIVDEIYSLFFSVPDKFLKATFFLVLTSLIAIPVAWYIDKKIPWMPIVTGIFACRLCICSRLALDARCLSDILLVFPCYARGTYPPIISIFTPWARRAITGRCTLCELTLWAKKTLLDTFCVVN